MRPLAALVMVALLSLAACSDDGPTGPPPNEIAGSWAGTGNDHGRRFSFNLDLDVNSQQIGGIGAFYYTAGGGAFVMATGTWTDPTFSMILSREGYQEDISFAGTVSGDTISGTFTGSGFSGELVKMTRTTPPNYCIGYCP